MKNFFLYLFSAITGLFTLNFGCNVDAFSSSVMLEARSQMDVRINRDIEMRKTYSKILDCALESTLISNPRIISGKDLQTAKITYLKNKLFTVNAARSCSPSGEQGGSGIATITFTHKNVSFWVSKSQAGVNDYDYISQLSANLYQAEQSLVDGINDYIVTQLSATESTVNLAHLQPNNFNVDVMEVASGDVKRFYSLVRSDMMINNFTESTMFYCICNSGFKALHAAFGFGGISNSLDTPEANLLKVYHTNKLTLGAYTSLHHIIPAGGLYFLSRVPDMYSGEIRGTKQMLTYGSKLYPGLVFQLTIDKNCTDTSATGGQVADAVDVYTLGIDFASSLLPLSNAGETMNYKYATTA